MLEFSLLQTKDGSPTIQSNQYNATYHSIFGAIEESIHVFISAGLYYQVNRGLKKIHIFEMGFGTGINAWLSCIEAMKYKIPVYYTSIEKHPLPSSIISKLSLHFQNHQMITLFDKVHEARWNEAIEINSYFHIIKVEEDIHNFHFKESFDVIYFDAFAPSCQPHLWELPLQSKLYNFVNKGGCLVTYCAQGQFKRTLKEIGYKIDRLNGPNRKHEMTRGLKV